LILIYFITGKLDSWEWDSGARDMSPVPKTITGTADKYAEDNNFKERLQQQLDEQAQRYEEQLTELHSVIAELTRKLHQQRTMAIAEEDEVSGNGALSFFAISQMSTFSSGPETKTILLAHRVSVSLLFDVTSHIF
jgi:TolA-binding protein